MDSGSARRRRAWASPISWPARTSCIRSFGRQRLPWLRVVSAGSVTDTASHDAYQHQIAESPRTVELFERARERGYTVIVDTPPGLGPVVNRVLACSQHVLVPLQCEPLALQTTTQILRGIRASLASNPSLVLDGILLTMVEVGNPASERVAKYVREQLPAGLVLDVDRAANRRRRSKPSPPDSRSCFARRRTRRRRRIARSPRYLVGRLE